MAGHILRPVLSNRASVLIRGRPIPYKTHYLTFFIALGPAWFYPMTKL